MLHFKERQQIYFADGIFHFIAESFLHLTICEMSENSDFDAAHTATIEAHIDNDDEAHKQMSDERIFCVAQKLFKLLNRWMSKKIHPKKRMKESANPALGEFVDVFAPHSIMVWTEHSEEKKKKARVFNKNIPSARQSN